VYNITVTVLYTVFCLRKTQYL